MARGIGRCDFANEYIAFGADGTDVHVVSHQRGTVIIFEQGGNSILAGPAGAHSPGLFYPDLFSGEIRGNRWRSRC